MSSLGSTSRKQQQYQVSHQRRQHGYTSSRVILACVAAAVLLSACGGGGGGGSDDPGDPPASAPAVTLEADIRQLRFDWDAVEDAIAYRLFFNPDGEAGFSQLGGNIGATNITVEVAAHRLDWDDAEFIVEACNRGGCRGSESIAVTDQMLDTIGYFKASNTDAGDSFGYSVALSANGATLAVGAYGEDSATTIIDGNPNNSAAGENSGAVYIFVRDGLEWEQQAYIKPSNTGAGDFFGTALALSDDGSTLVVGATDEDSSSAGGGGQNDDVENSGAVYVFSRADGDWSQDAVIKASNIDEDDNFGEVVALSGDGDTLAVSAYREASGDPGNPNNNARPSAGAVYLYSRTNQGWDFDRYLKAPNPDQDDVFGTSLALDSTGETLAVGAPGDDGSTNGMTDSGAVYVFVENNDEWQQQAYVRASNADQGDRFGGAVSLSDDGDMLAVGAAFEASDATGIDGDEADDSIDGAGAAYIFTREGNAWTQQTYFKASNTDWSDNFGAALALSGSGTALAVGAPFENGTSVGIGGDQTADPESDYGAVYFFAFADDEWSQQSYVKATNTSASDSFGAAVALSRNAAVMAVGASMEDGDATGVGGDSNQDAVNAGAVYLY
ncbi:integrin [Exilibacterium tricleocarpae]|uniref:Integrin n=1 Tax=Exilibacterium tricleocarpae TaxID=2591008 RepID=A0A545TAP6_9GAMM|nr:integrin [Exilibacterium tricleocarpae]TQV74277.1 integrin [Exilibacterium tricleocarpae]